MRQSTPSLKKEKDFKEIYSSGKKTFSSRAILYYKPAKELRLGVSISKKQGSAVKRNRAKRLIKEFFRLNYRKVLPANIIVVAKAPLLNSYDETNKIMLELLRKAGLIK